jgi:WD40 repeat protein
MPFYIPIRASYSLTSLARSGRIVSCDHRGTALAQVHLGTSRRDVRGLDRDDNVSTGVTTRTIPAGSFESPDHERSYGRVGPTSSADGRSVLTWALGNDVRVWEPGTGSLRYLPLRHRDKCHDVQFSPDGKLMTLASYDGSVRFRDLATGRVVVELPAHPDIVYSARFSPDGRLLVTACRDRTVRVWDWRLGVLACPPFEHGKDAIAAIFTPNGQWVLSASVDGTARAWDWRSGKPITPPLPIEGEPVSVAVTPDGKHAIIGGGQSALAVLDLGVLTPKDHDLDVDALCLQAELLARQQLHRGGCVVNLSAAEWLDRWRTFRRQSPLTDIGTPRIDLGTAPP